ncbi:SDR family NAD(P)-dependent oxidoreductase [Thalassobaculum sp.]|uniref:type I polyketide synthase n=1 Tax=Thalassobaculum sp. TaxID=2022740 RepID=UPI0032EEB0C9
MSAVVEDQLRRAITTIRSLRQEVEGLRAERRPAIAVVGVGCRLPGGIGDLDSLYAALMRGADAIVEVPADRWDADAWFDPDPDAPGRMNTRWGGFLDGIDRFDPGFFELSAREAASMDPQQRLLLECAWEAMEDACLAVDRLKGSATGVWVGINASEYYAMGIADPAAIDAHAISGGVASVAAGRLSYLMGFNGPAVAVDTACSSSLAAVHLAVQSLRSGETDLALAGGVYAVLQPNLTVGLSKLHMMAADGRCKSFDAAADGFVQGEGCAVVALKRLADAAADGDPVLAVIRGSAMNQDGRSGSLTAPSRSAQVQVIRAALADAGIAPEAIGYVEAHGTGTALGDPIEVHALADALGRERTRPLVLGALKSNIGHLGPAAGIAGLVKAVAVVRAGRIPPNLHFHALNPNIALDGLPAVFPTVPMAWPEGDGPRSAGVSSFGFSGTNVHVVLEQVPEAAPPAAVDGPVVLAVSARDEAALAEAVRRHVDAQADGTDLAAAARTMLLGRRHFEHRAAVVARTPAEARGRLAKAAPVKAAARPRLGLLFTGQGAWAAGTGRALAEALPLVRDTLERAEALVPGVRATLFEAAGDRADTARAQPALLALQWALTAQLRAWGVEAIACAGHSVGEIAAAASCGLIAWEDALRFAAERGRLMGALPAGGAMAAAMLETAAAEALATRSGLSVAAINGPRSVVLSGEAGALDAAVAGLDADGVPARRLAVSHAFHSALMDPALAGLSAVAPSGAGGTATLVSTLTGAAATAVDPAHWARHAREPVRFADALAALTDLGCTSLLEIGPGTTLRDLARPQVGAVQAVSALGGDVEAEGLLEAVAALHCQGVAVDWQAVLPAGPRTRLPTYPFQRRRYWREAGPAVATAGAAWPPGERVVSPAAEAQFRLPVGLSGFPWLGDHRVHGRAVVPGAFQIACLAGAWRDLHGAGPCRIAGLTFARPLTLPEDGTVEVWTTLGPAGAARLLSRDGEDWTPHADARLGPAAGSADGFDIVAARRRCGAEVAPAEWRDRLAGIGIAIGPAFGGIRRMWRGDGEALAEIRLPDGLYGPPGGFHPALLDACLQVAGGTLAEDMAGEPLLPVGIDRVDLLGALAGPLWVHARGTGRGDVIGTDLTVAAADGTVLAAVEGLHVRRAPAALLQGDAAALFHAVDWQHADMPVRAAGGRVVIVADDPEAGHALAACLGERPTLACDPASLPALADGDTVVDLTGWATDGVEVGVGRSLALAQRILVGAARPALAVVTQGAVQGQTRPWQAARWGLAATLALEHPELRVRRIDADELASVALELSGAGDEDAVAWRDGTRRVARLVRLRPERRKPAALRGTVLITGGLGGVGRRLAAWAAARGAEALVLAGRSADTATGEGLSADLGVPVRVVAADVADLAGVRTMLAAADGLPPLRTVIHAAGVQAPGLLAELSPERLGEVLAAKARGAELLDRAARDLGLDHFVLVSSIASVLGAAGQGGYAAANAFLDALARRRRAEGLPALSVAWGRWAEAGMAGDLDDAARRRVEALGIREMDDAAAFEAMDLALAGDRADRVVAAVDWRRHAERHPSGRVPPLLAALVGGVAAAPAVDELLERLKTPGLANGERAAVLLDWMTAQAGRILGADSAGVAADRPLVQLGLDSLMAVELRNRLSAGLGQAPSIALLLGGATLAEVADRLAADRPAEVEAPEWEELTL